MKGLLFLLVVIVVAIIVFFGVVVSNDDGVIAINYSSVDVDDLSIGYESIPFGIADMVCFCSSTGFLQVCDWGNNITRLMNDSYSKDLIDRGVIKEGWCEE